MAARELSNIEDILRELLQPGFEVYARLSNAHDNMEILILESSSGSYETIQYDYYKFNVMDDLLDEIALTAMGSKAFDMKPKYWRVFNHLIHKLLYSEFTPGKLWG